MAGGTLYTYPDNFRAFKALIAAKYSGADVKVAPDFKFGETNQTEAFLSKFPTGKVPAFEGKDGLILFESNAIAYYVGDQKLHGSSPADASRVLQWINYADNEIVPASCTWVFPCLGIMQFNKQNTERAKAEVKKALSVLNQHLQSCTYLVGERITLADVCVACDLLQLYQWVLDPEFREPYQNVNRWFVTMVNQKEVKSVIGEFKMCEKMEQFNAKKFQEFQASQKGGATGGKKDQKKEKKQEKPKAKEAAPTPDEEDPEPAAEKPAKDPFAAFPKGSFDMDAFKRCYSNNDCDVSIPYFWENFDKENYTIWRGSYKYNDELEKIFMSCNLVSGMFQRLDRMRKHAFGSVCIFGEDKNNCIDGIWVWRGQGLAFELSDDLQVDYESYAWKKLDPAADKKMIDEFFSWEGDFEGRKFNQGKIFK